MNLSGRSREEIDRTLARKTRAELVDLIYSLSTIEPHFTPSEIARRSGMTKRTILADIHAGRFNGEYYKRAGNQITVSASGVNAWRRSFRVEVENSDHRDSR
jgi:hypothetical protein